MTDHTDETEEYSDEMYRQPDGTPKKTGRVLHESIAAVRITDTPAPNDRVAIHVEHPGHDGGVRCFWRDHDTDVTASIRSHLRTELPDDIARVEVIDKAGVGVVEAELLPRGMARSTPFEDATEVSVQ